MTKTKIDPSISIANALGADMLDPTVGERYSQLRQASSANTLAALAAQDQEYARRQGRRNLEFVTGIARAFPHQPQVTYETIKRSRYKGIMSADKIHETKLSNIACTFTVAEQSVEAIDGDTLAALSSIRATTVWIPTPTDKVVKLEEHTSWLGDRSVTKTKEDTIDMPHIMIGHRAIEGGDYIEVVMLPLGGRTTKPITARMTTSSFSRLTEIQDTLLGEGLSPEEVRGAHDSASGTFKINPSLVSCVRATMRRSAIGMAMSRKPSDHTDLDEDFDLMATDTVIEEIHPNDFTYYHVLADTQRLFAMAGALDVFEKHKNDLMQSSLRDPALKLLED